MSDAVETAKQAVDIEAKAVELIDQLTAGLKAAAPQMADVTLAAVRAEAIGSLVTSTLWSVIWLIGCIVAFRTVRTGLAMPKQTVERHYLTPEEKRQEKAEWLIHCGGIGGTVSALLLLANFSSLLSRSYWIAAYDPRLAIAIRVINKLL